MARVGLQPSDWTSSFGEVDTDCDPGTHFATLFESFFNSEQNLDSIKQAWLLARDLKDIDGSVQSDLSSNDLFDFLRLFAQKEFTYLPWEDGANILDPMNNNPEMGTDLVSFSDLPSSPGIYLFSGRPCFEMLGFDPDGFSSPLCLFPLYVGSSVNLSQRFISHHKLKELDFLCYFGWIISFHFVAENQFLKFKDLRKTESDLIALLRPMLNGKTFLPNGNTQEPVELPTEVKNEVELVFGDLPCTN